MINIRYILVGMSLLLLFAAEVQCYQEDNNIESKLGGFDFDSKLITDQQLINMYGIGCVEGNYPDHHRRIYYYADDNIYVAFDISTDGLVVGLRIAKLSKSSQRCKSTMKLVSYMTGKKVTIGDKKEKLYKTYGKPSVMEDKHNNIHLLRYYTDREEGPYMEIELFNDRIVSIWITVAD